MHVFYILPSYFIDSSKLVKGLFKKRFNPLFNIIVLSILFLNYKL